MPVYFASLMLGIVAGLRSMTAPAVVSWAAYLGWLHLENTWLAFLGYRFTPIVLTALAIGELVADKLPSTPARKSLVPFAARIMTGALCGGAIGLSLQNLIGGILAGILGAVVGTLGGYEFRTRLVKATGGRDLPIALLEDAVAIAAAVLFVSRLSG